MDDPPNEKFLYAFILHDIGESNSDMKRVRRAWMKINRKGKELEKSNCIARETYTQRVKVRA